MIKKKTRRLAALSFLSALLVAPVGGQGTSSDPPSRTQRAEELLRESTRAPDPVLVLARARAARRLFAEAEDPQGEAMSLLIIGSAEAFLDDAEAARASFDRSAELFEEVPESLGQYLVRVAEAETWRSMGDFDDAVSGFERALEELGQLESSGGELSLEAFRYLMPMELPREAIDEMQTMLAALTPVWLQLLRATTLVEIAAVRRSQGRLEQALEVLDQAQTLATPFPQLLAQVATEKAELELAMGHSARAQALFHAALPIAREAVDLQLQARALHGLAELHAQRGEQEAAAEYREQAEALVPDGLEGPKSGPHNPICNLTTPIRNLPPP